MNLYINLLTTQIKGGGYKKELKSPNGYSYTKKEMQTTITQYMTPYISNTPITTKRTRQFNDSDRQRMNEKIQMIAREGGSFYLQLRVNQILSIPTPFFSETGRRPLCTYHQGNQISLRKLIKSQTGWPSARFVDHLFYVTSDGERLSIDV